MDLALDCAFEECAHTQADMTAVREALQSAPIGRVPEWELIGFARAWLDAAMYLRLADLPVTFATLAGVVAAGHTTSASIHARKLLALACAPANETLPAAPATPVRVTVIPKPPVRYRGNRRCAYCGVRNELGMCDSCGRA
jgi:hypothetical protein